MCLAFAEAAPLKGHLKFLPRCVHMREWVSEWVRERERERERERDRQTDSVCVCVCVCVSVWLSVMKPRGTLNQQTLSLAFSSVKLKCHTKCFQTLWASTLVSFPPFKCSKWREGWGEWHAKSGWQWLSCCQWNLAMRRASEKSYRFSTFLLLAECKQTNSQNVVQGDNGVRKETRVEINICPTQIQQPCKDTNDTEHLWKAHLANVSGENLPQNTEMLAFVSKEEPTVLQATSSKALMITACAFFSLSLPRTVSTLSFQVCPATKFLNADAQVVTDTKFPKANFPSIVFTCVDLFVGSFVLTHQNLWTTAGAFSRFDVCQTFCANSGLSFKFWKCHATFAFWSCSFWLEKLTWIFSRLNDDWKRWGVRLIVPDQIHKIRRHRQNLMPVVLKLSLHALPLGWGKRRQHVSTNENCQIRKYQNLRFPPAKAVVWYTVIGTQDTNLLTIDEGQPQPSLQTAAPATPQHFQSVSTWICHKASKNQQQQHHHPMHLMPDQTKALQSPPPPRIVFIFPSPLEKTSTYSVSVRVRLPRARCQSVPGWLCPNLASPWGELSKKVSPDTATQPAKGFPSNLNKEKGIEVNSKLLFIRAMKLFRLQTRTVFHQSPVGVELGCSLQEVTPVGPQRRFAFSHDCSPWL